MLCLLQLVDINNDNKNKIDDINVTAIGFVGDISEKVDFAGRSNKLVDSEPDHGHSASVLTKNDQINATNCNQSDSGQQTSDKAKVSSNQEANLSKDIATKPELEPETLESRQVAADANYKQKLATNKISEQAEQHGERNGNGDDMKDVHVAAFANKANDGWPSEQEVDGKQTEFNQLDHSQGISKQSQKQIESATLTTSDRKLDQQLQPELQQYPRESNEIMSG